jgi:putative spermidine/putrescine transport system permease protein
MRQKVANGALTVLSTLICLFLILPTVVVAPVSFTTTDYITFPPIGFSTQWYAAFFQRPEWWGSLVTSTVVALATMVLATGLCTMIALGLPKLTRRANRIISFFFLLPMIVPAIVTAVALYQPFSQMGIIATIPGLILAHTILAMPFVIINVSAIVQKLDWRMVDAARSLGAPPATAFRRVTLPILAPGIAAGAVFAFLTSFDEVVVSLFVSGTGAMPLSVQMWNGIRFEISPIVAAASCLLLVVSCLLLAVFGLLKRRI